MTSNGKVPVSLDGVSAETLRGLYESLGRYLKVVQQVEQLRQRRDKLAQALAALEG
jgi:hypothetical protein